MADERAALDTLIAQVEQRFAGLLSPFARDLVRRVSRSASRGGTVGPVGREALSRWLPGALAALFGGSPAQVERLYTEPNTVPYLLRASLRATARVAVAPVVADVSARLSAQSALLAVVTGPATNPRPPIFDPARTWLDPNGHKLSDRIWLASEDLRSRIDGLLDYHIQRGTNAVEIGRELEIYLAYDGRINARGEQVVTRTPYGRSGLARPRTLARTEITRAYGAATTEAARTNPFVAGLRWRLSASHPQQDQCDERANANPDGLGKGVYRVDGVPRYPDHPNCLCSLLPMTRQDSAAVIAALARGEAVPGGLDAATIVTSVTGF